MNSKVLVGRFAPSPTGALHLGSLIAATGSYLFAKAAGGEWLLRMEDLDTPRVVPGAADGILRTLELFALYWDGEVTYQSSRGELYEEALSNLLQSGMAYPCGCTRREIQALASAPHPGEEGPIYPGTCRGGLPKGHEPRAYRVIVPDQEIFFDDLLRGKLGWNLANSIGDFVVKRADGIFAYQLAVAVDDALGGVTQVIRGSDLLSSTPRQILLQRLLGYPTPRYGHLPLVTAPDGEKLSKRDNLVNYGTIEARQGQAGKLLESVLDFLGHAPPADLSGAPPNELLRYATENFDKTRIPLSNRPLIG
ncbi:MAG: tRNA glutamyl-Q(34) synthetase GluQRS [Deltaproteobacteria bacterium]|nr:MAG: tRNA glutamyl-Q(34) synthetase GluQRS [Deltaproteobacteria bacterium]